jgi:DNA-binding transcriptional ArsR family regulator
MKRIPYNEKRYPAKELKILRHLLKEPKLSTKELSIRIHTYERTISVALRYLRKRGFVETEKHGQNVINYLTPYGKVVAKLVIGIIDKIRPGYLSLEQAFLDSNFLKVRELISGSVKILKHSPIRHNIEPIEPLKSSEFAEVCYDRIVLSSFSKISPIKISETHHTSSEAICSLLDGKIDMAILPMTSIEGLLHDKQHLQDIVVTGISSPVGYACILETGAIKKDTIYFPEGSIHRKMTASKIAEIEKLKPSPVNNGTELVKGSVTNDYSLIVTHAPYDTLLHTDFGFKTKIVDADPGLIVVNRNALSEHEKSVVNAFIESQYDSFSYLSQKSWQYRIALDYVTHVMPDRLKRLKTIIPSLTFL